MNATMTQQIPLCKECIAVAHLVRVGDKIPNYQVVLCYRCDENVAEAYCEVLKEG